jgi:tRNA (guanine-N7-)-methyltransferase
MLRSLLGSIPKKHLESSTNPYVSRLIDSGVFYGPSLEENRGRWASLFDEKDLFLEIGCHQGTFLNHLAQTYPGCFLGCDITYKRVYEAAQKVKGKKAGVLYMRAEGLPLVFAREELSGIVLLCPDPWPKKKQNRLVQESWVASLVPLLKPGGFVWFQTDHEEYFCEASLVLDRHLKQGPLGVFATSGVKSPYAKRFLKAGRLWEGYWYALPEDRNMLT